LVEDIDRATTELAKTYQLVRQAVLDHGCVSAVYDARVRHFCPHALGLDKDGAVRVLGLQYGGESTRALSAGGDWRCFRLAGLTEVRRNADRWRTRPGHSQANSCVVRVDVEAYESSTPKLANAAEAPIIARLRRPARKAARATDPVRE
jgi:hypothetical protein